MADHREMIHATAAPPYGGATTSSAAQAGHGGGDWWSTVVATSCSPEMAGFGGASAWSAAAAAGHADVQIDGGNRSRSSNNTASSESPGSNSLATGSSITFQEPAGVAEAATVAVPHTVAAGFATGWNHQPFLDGSSFHGYMSTRSDDHQNHINAPGLMSHSPSNNSMMQLQLQDHHDQNYQFLSNLGFELLSSPTSPYGGGFRSSLVRSLTEPVAAAAARPSSPESQQYQQQTAANQAPPAAAIGRQPLQFTNNTPFWNPSTGFATAADGAGLAAAGPPPETRLASFAAKSVLEGVGDSSSIITKKGPTPLKKARTGTSTPLPTFKVRKEKLGDRVTALQQLVSPFGKTDTASVLHETIDYIKFLHEQVGALSAPYLKNRQQVPHLKGSGEKPKDGGETAAAAKRDLTGRGLCLVPISSTFAVASQTPVDFWTPFGAAFR